MRLFLSAMLGLTTIMAGSAALADPAPVITGSRVTCDADYDTPKDKIAAFEAACLGKTEGIVSRDGDKLIVKIADGKTKTFDSNPKACEEDEGDNCKNVWLQIFDPKVGYALVVESYYESGAYQLIDLKTGEMTDILAIPEFSPAGNQLVSVIINEMDAPEEELMIYDLTASPFKKTLSVKYGTALKLAKRKKDSSAFFSFDGWDGEDKIRLKIGDGGETTYAKALVTRKDGKWTLGLAPKAK
jgi:hypothetical protein